MTLRREVEAPRTGTGLWLPFMALASAAMLTIVSGVAVMTRAPRPVVAEPVEMSPEPKGLSAAERTEIDRLIEATHKRTQERKEEAASRMDAAPRVLCRAPVRRGNIDGQAQPYDECIAPRGVLPAATLEKREAR